jgi:hypothetical protein
LTTPLRDNDAILSPTKTHPTCIASAPPSNANVASSTQLGGAFAAAAAVDVSDSEDGSAFGSEGVIVLFFPRAVSSAAAGIFVRDVGVELKDVS